MINRKLTDEEIKAFRETNLSKDSFDKLASFYTLFADSTRLSIVGLLVRYELCVSDIAAILCLSQSLVSHQLAVLRKEDIVTYHRHGKRVLYALTDNHIHDLFSTGIEHISEKDVSVYKDRRKKGL
jgi:ArsR family transcriptional regulator, lead/cadmium/zinc/bismuth-responsive transcriptional repressor